MTDARISRGIAQVLVEPAPPSARISQGVTQTLVKPIPATARMSQGVVQVLTSTEVPPETPTGWPPPTDFEAEARDTGAAVSWTEPEPGSSTVTGYRIVASRGGHNLLYEIGLDTDVELGGLENCEEGGGGAAPYAFTDGESGDDDATWDATVIPYLSDDSDATFLHFGVSEGEHYTLHLDGDPSIIPADSSSVTSITITIRARAQETPGTDQTSLNFSLHASFTEYVEYGGGPPDYLAVVLPVGSGFTDLTLTLTEADAIAAAGAGDIAWESGGTWTDLASLVDKMRTAGTFYINMQRFYAEEGADWDIAYANLTFDTGGP